MNIVNRSLARAAALLAVLATVQILLQLPYLPAPMAVRFGWEGQPVGWSTPHSFAIANLVIIAIIIAVTIILPGLMGKRPRIRWRMPNREHWLAPERLPATVDYIKRQLAWHGIMTLLLLMSMFQLVINANQQRPIQLDNARFAIFVGIYVAFVLLWALAYWRKFSRLPSDRGDNPFG